MNPECLKCGARMAGPWYVKGCGALCHPEYLEYTCRCGYKTTRPTRDAKIAPRDSGNAVESGGAGVRETGDQ